MDRFPSRAIVSTAALAVVFLSLSCGGGDGTPTGNSPPEPPPAVASVTVTPAATALLVGETVQLAAATLDATGATLAGRTVTWTTDDAQVATVTSAGLVAAVGPGSATITATSEGQSGTATVTVTTPLFAPTADTNLSGSLTFTEVAIPTGVTVTVTSDLTMDVEGPVSIDGTLAGECVNITINGQSTVTIQGTINNGCTQGQAVTADLTIVGDGDLTLENASFEVGGNVTIKNDPTLTDADFPAASAKISSAALAAATSSQAGTCRATNTIFLARPTQAPSGVDGQDGTDGERGKTWKLMCRGNAILAGGVRVFGQDGGDGGRGAHEHNQKAEASGGFGGVGGDLRLLATGTWEFTGSGNELIPGNGGIGGFARADGLQNPNINPAASAFALGGGGAESGIVEVRSLVGIVPVAQPGVLTVEVGDGGAGGNAVAIGAHGMHSDERPGVPAQHGGDAFALGGFGGDSPDLKFGATGAASPVNVTLAGGDGGEGGDAHMDPGDGGNGDEDFPDGGDGGDTEVPDEDSNGGKGGDALVKDASGNTFGAGGKGGNLEVLGGNGGFGFDGCGVFPIKNGGDGGDGGVMRGTDGRGGTGKTDGDPGGVGVFEFTGMGGVGGDGEPEVGKGGFKGLDLITPRGPRTNTGRIFEDGDDGEPCDLAFNVAITVKSGGDPNGHEEFIQLGAVTMISLRMLTSGTIEFTSGSAEWIDTNGPVMADGSFTTTGIGIAATIPGVPVSFDGEVVLDADGVVTGITGMLVYDTSNSVLPPQPDPPDGDGMRHEVNYSLTGTVKPPA